MTAPDFVAAVAPVADALGALGRIPATPVRIGLGRAVISVQTSGAG